jgi:hypothetical protein
MNKLIENFLNGMKHENENKNKEKEKVKYY